MEKEKRIIPRRLAHGHGLRGWQHIFDELVFMIYKLVFMIPKCSSVDAYAQRKVLTTHFKVKTMCKL